MMPLSPFARSVKPSATLAAGAKAKELRAQGVQLFDFSLGEPDQNTPDFICDAAYAGMKAGHTHYTPAAGVTELRKAVAKHYKRLHNWDVDYECVVISNGAKHGIHNALASAIGPGDEVIIPMPYWVSYGDLVQMTGATPVLVPTTVESGFKIQPGQFRAAVTPRTRLIMLNSPNNPTGTVYTRAELTALADAILETQVGILSDEIYEQLCYGDAKPTCVATLRPELAARTITVSGASKSYAMTGWRMGWSVAPPHIAAAMAGIQSQETGPPSSVSQYAVRAALEGPQDAVAQMRNEYAARRELVYGLLEKIPRLKLHRSDGAFYAFFDVSAFFPKLGVADSAAFCAKCLELAKVNLVPGSAFGCEGYVRMSYASNRQEIEGGLKALAAWLTA